MVSFFPFGGALLWLFNMMGQLGQLTADTSFTWLAIRASVE